MATAEVAAPQHTDLANADEFIADHKFEARYCGPRNAWLVWDGSRWRWDDTQAVIALAQQTVKRMLAEALGIVNYQQHSAAAKHAINSGARARIDAMLYLAQPHLSVRVDDLDADPLLLNVLNGTLNLRTGKLQSHRPDQLITKLAPVAYDPAADAPHWLRFLADITHGNQEIAGYLQRAVGYSLTGETCEHTLFMLYGAGCNGKTTFIEALRTVFGEYAKTADFSTFMQRQGSGGPRNDLAMLSGSRLVTATESDDGNQLAEAFVKQITGGDKVTARFLYGEHFEFTPTFKLWLSTNHKPNIHGTDDGIWRRIRLIPFTVRISEDKIDHHLAEKLRAEAAGILLWAIEGLRQYREHGLAEPACIKNATSEYRQDEDPVGRFLITHCLPVESANIPARLLYSTYKTWAANNAERGVDERKFAKLLAERGMTSKRNKTGVCWQGITLTDPTAGVGCRVM